jgi:hypothetical protein
MKLSEMQRLVLKIISKFYKTNLQGFELLYFRGSQNWTPLGMKITIQTDDQIFQFETLCWFQLSN